jgi:preprotein translocase subunit SecY
MIKVVQNILRIPELRKKIFITVALLFVYRVGFHVPIPGMNFRALAEKIQQQYSGAVGSFLGLLDVFSAGDFQSGALFSLGIMPYISASIIFSLLAKVVPALEKVAKEGQAGQKKINQYTRYLTPLLCVFQSFLVVKGVIPNLLNAKIFVIDPELYHTFWWQAHAILALTTGTIFLMWLGEQITEYGIGNGISMLIMAGIVARMPVSIYRYLLSAGELAEKAWHSLILVALFVGVVVVVIYITKGQRRVLIQAARFTRGQKVFGGQRHYLPLKVNQPGVMPVIFASSLLIFPSAFFQGVGLQPLADALHKSTGWWYISIYITLIFFFSFFWNSLMIQPTEMANNMKEYGSFIPGIRPGRKTAEYIERIMMHMTLAGAAFLSVIALVPQIVADTLAVPVALSSFLGGTSILIVVGVALDLVDKVNSHLLMRNYEGFMRRGGGGGTFGR